MIELPVLSEEERRLLREYRITKIPPRRPSPVATTPGSSNCNTSSQIDAHHDTKHKHQQRYQEHATQVQPQELPIQRSQSQRHSSHESYRNDHHNNNNSKHHGRHHHHHHHKRKHKSITPTQELTGDDLSKMLELTSSVSYLGLDSPLKMTDSDTTNTTKAKAEAATKIATTNGITKTTTTSIATNTNLSDRLYIFEKVDYIKKVAIRRKALRKLNKSNLKQKAAQ